MMSSAHPRSLRFLRYLPLLAAAALPWGGLPAQSTPDAVEAPESAVEAPSNPGEALARVGVQTTAGPALVDLGTVAKLTLEEGQWFIGPDSVARYYELTQNTPNGNEVGVLLGSTWTLYFDFEEVGYIKDDEKDQLDADKLIKTLREGQEQANQARQERGWDTLRLEGWAAVPHYDEQTHHLKWAINLSSSADQHQSIWINENIRLLGRKGLMSVTLVCDQANFAQAMPEADAFLANNFQYVDGERYEEFRPGDKLAAYGLTALVLGGGAAAAAKLGLFANLAPFLGKIWKALVAGVIAIAAGFRKIMLWLSGRPTQSPTPPSSGDGPSAQA